jgi:sigma-B regulation protein RsbU (phosphoserine phosphatase)
LLQEQQVLVEELAATKAQLERLRAELRAARGIIAEYERVQRDLELARQMQRQMLPEAFPDFPELVLAATTLPSWGIGGDFYDVVRLDRHRVGLLLGDVAGKGIHAALAMARLMGDFRACVRDCAEPQDVMEALNGLLCQRHTRVSSFVTVQYLVLDMAAQCLHFICAGHSPILRRRADGHVEPLGAASNIPLGIEASVPYHQETCACAPGETLLLYSDGVYERQSRQGECLGLARLQEWFTAAPTHPEAIITTIQTALATFGDARTLHDDTTLLCAHLRADRHSTRWGRVFTRAHTAHLGHVEVKRGSRAWGRQQKTRRRQRRLAGQP